MADHTDTRIDSPLGRDAIIYLPGLLSGAKLESADAVARRMAAAMNYNAHTATASFSVLDEQDEPFGGGGRTQVATVVREDGSEKRSVVDVYSFGYRTPLVGGFERRKPIFQALSVGAVLLINVPRAIFASRRPSKSRSEKAQLLYGCAGIVLLVAYLISLVIAIGGTVAEVLPGEPRLGANLSEWLNYVKNFVIAATAAGLFVRFNYKELLALVATNLSAAINYVAHGRRRNAILGDLAKLLDYIEEKASTGTRYEKIHVVAFSFGSLIALDSLFQHARPNARFKRIDTLVTIGCPFDFIRTYWPNYFERRESSETSPRRWMNVFAPADVFGSNFRDEAGSGNSVSRGIALKDQPPRGPDENVLYGQDLPLEQHSWLAWLTLVGFRLHTSYWERDSENGLSCFEPIVRSLYQDHYALS